MKKEINTIQCDIEITTKDPDNAAVGIVTTTTFDFVENVYIVKERDDERFLKYLQDGFEHNKKYMAKNGCELVDIETKSIKQSISKVFCEIKVLIKNFKDKKIHRQESASFEFTGNDEVEFLNTLQASFECIKESFARNGWGLNA